MMTTVDEVAFTVEAGKVREFAVATRTTSRAHVGTAALATATHVMVCGHHRDQRAMLDLLGLALERVVVGSVRWVHHRPLVVGDELHGIRRVTGDRTRPGLRIVTLETMFTDHDGAPVVTLTETVLEKGIR